MNRGFILKACLNLYTERSWKTLGEYDAKNGREIDHGMLEHAKSHQRKAYEAAYKENSI